MLLDRHFSAAPVDAPLVMGRECSSACSPQAGRHRERGAHPGGAYCGRDRHDRVGLRRSFAPPSASLSQQSPLPSVVSHLQLQVLCSLQASRPFHCCKPAGCLLCDRCRRADDNLCYRSDRLNSPLQSLLVCSHSRKRDRHNSSAIDRQVRRFSCSTCSGRSKTSSCFHFKRETKLRRCISRTAEHHRLLTPSLLFPDQRWEQCQYKTPLSAGRFVRSNFWSLFSGFRTKSLPRSNAIRASLNHSTL